jgi:hypothetical protein
MNGATTLRLSTPVAVLLIGIAVSCGSPNERPGCSADPNDIPFIEELTLPPDLPKGLRLATACYRGEESVAMDVEFFYASDTGSLVLVVLAGQGVPVEQKGRRTIQLGELVGYFAETQEPGGTTHYGVEFEKDERSYGVGARLGPTNDVTQDDINAVALSIAEK